MRYEYESICYICLSLPSTNYAFTFSTILRMSAFLQFQTIKDLTEAEISQLKQHCYRGNVEVDSHYLFLGRKRDDYGMVTFSLRGVQYHFRRHILSLFLKLHDDGITDWPDGYQASHLCHTKRCIRPDHLHLEDRATNKLQDACLKDKLCRGHGDAPLCIL